MKICLEWFEMPCIGIYSGLFEITLVFLELDAPVELILGIGEG
jgi:hypothetical protein